MTPDGRYAISASLDKTLKVWDWATGELVRTLEGHADSVYGVAVTPDGRHAISASLDNTLKVWVWPTGKLVATLMLGDPLVSVAVRSDSLTLVAGGMSGRVHFLRLENV